MNQENEKKEYTKPEMEVVAFSQQANLLEGSCLGPDGSYGCNLN
jgi:hypothetical protein